MLSDVWLHVGDLFLDSGSNDRRVMTGNWRGWHVELCQCLVQLTSHLGGQLKMNENMYAS